MIYPVNYEQKVGFDRVRGQIKALCSTVAAAEIADSAPFMSDSEAVAGELGLTAEMKTAIMMEADFPGGGFVDTREFLGRVVLEGAFLDVHEIVSLRKALSLVAELTSFFKSKSEEQYPGLKELSARVEAFPEVIARIDKIIDQFGKVRDNASPELFEIRTAIRQREGQISKRLQQILSQARDSGVVEEDSAISIRDGRAVIPVPAANKRKLKGFIHDESATGKTVYIEPIEIVEINNELKELEYSQRREIVRILVAFTDFLRPMIGDIKASGEYLTTMDFICAKARHAIANRCAMPILSPGSGLYLRNARHLLLEQTLQRDGKAIVPLNMELNQKNRILLISGPNAGGKSVCLKTVGLLQYMLQCGMLIPVSENSEMGIFDDLFIDIGDEQSIDNDLSTYSSHLLNMKNILRGAGKRSMVMIDEFGTGTEPIIGGAIAESVLEQLVVRGCFGVITTHYSNLKYYAGNTEGIANGAMMFDVQHIQPLFRLEMGKPGSSFAIEIARKIGLPENIIRSAMDKAGSGHVSIERQLREIARDRHYWEQKREKVRQSEKTVEELEERYRRELEGIKAEKNRLIGEARAEAVRITTEANRQIENTIRRIRESQAEKESTLIVRREMEAFRSSLKDPSLHDDNISQDELERKIAKLKEREKRRGERKEQKATEAQREPAAETVRPTVISEGTKVRIKGQQVLGEVLELQGKRATVAFGQIRTVVDVSRLEAVSNAEFKKSVRDNRAPAQKTNFDTAERKSRFSGQLNVRGMRAAEALEAVQEFMDDAVMTGVSEVRILHGKGTGALKEEIRKWLATMDAVRSAKDEHEELGGAGITVVKMNV